MELKSINDLKKLVFKKNRFIYCVRIFCITIIMAVMLVLPLLFSEVIDLLAENKYNEAIVIILIGILLVIIYRTLGYVKNHLWHVSYKNIYDLLSDILIKKTMSNSLFSLSRFSVGEYINLMHTDLNIICNNTCNIFYKVLSFLSQVFVLLYFFLIDFYVGVIGVISITLLLLVMFFTQKHILKVNLVKSKNDDYKNNLLDEFLINIKEIKSNNVFNLTYNRTKKATKKYLGSFMKQRVIEDFYKHLMLFMIELFRWGLMMFGIYLISVGEMTIGTILIIYNYYAQLIAGSTELVMLSRELLRRKVAYERIFKLFEYSNEYNYNRKHSDLIVSGTICFKDVLYGYKDDPMLNEFSIELKSKKVYGIVGKAGSGKSAIFHLLLKLNRQHQGTVTIDDIDINDYILSDYLKLMYIIREESNYLNLSFRDIIKDSHVKFSKVVENCKLLSIHDKITKFTDGYDSILNDCNLNQSEKVLFSFAIAFASKASIYLIDMAIDIFDYDIKMVLLDKIVALKEEKNIIIITKSADVLEKTDDVIFMESGKIKYFDNHDNLIGNKEYNSIINF